MTMKWSTLLFLIAGVWLAADIYAGATSTDSTTPDWWNNSFGLIEGANPAPIPVYLMIAAAGLLLYFHWIKPLPDGNI